MSQRLRYGMIVLVFVSLGSAIYFASLAQVFASQPEKAVPLKSVRLDKKATTTVQEKVIKPGDLLYMHYVNIPEGNFPKVICVEPSGKAPLGAEVGRVDVKGMTIEEAEKAIVAQYATVFREFKLQVTFYNATAHGDSKE